MDDASALTDETDDEAGEQRTGTEPNPHDFGAAQQALNDAAKRVNAVWISFVLLCVYIFIATYTVTPAALFREAPVKLPIFNADLPLKVYFILAPLLILCLHAYFIVLAKDLAEKIDKYEDILRRMADTSATVAAGRRVLRARLDNSVIVRAMNARYRDTRSAVDLASSVIAGLTMTVLPVALLLLTQLKFLPYQEQWMTWAHRGFVIFDFFLCLWLLWPFSMTTWLTAVGRFSVGALILLAATTSVLFATFPGEWIDSTLYDHWPHAVTAKFFEGPRDPVDYVHHGGGLPFPNRLILPDDPKLTGIAEASAGSVSLSVRGRNFRKAVFDRSTLTGVDFSGADLTLASLQGAHLEGAKCECTTPARATDQSAAVAPEGYAEYANWRRLVESKYGYYEYEPYINCTNLYGVNLSRATLNRASLHFAQLSQANLFSATLENASFWGAEMAGADLREASVQGADFSDAGLVGASFSLAKGSAVKFSRARLTAADFGGAQLVAAIFNRAMLQGASFVRASLTAADFNDTHVQAADLSGAELLAASFEGAYLQDATLDSTKIKGASFRSASLRGASLKCVTPFRTDFTNTDLVETVLNAKCETGWYDTFSSFYPDRAADKYDLKDDRVPAKGEDYYGFTPDTRYPIYDSPEKLSAEEFKHQINDVVLSKLPEEAKPRVQKAFERLKPGAQTKEQDEAEKSFWTEWAKRPHSPESHDEALAARLESIACVAEGAPYTNRPRT